jgi:exosortase
MTTIDTRPRSRPPGVLDRWGAARLAIVPALALAVGFLPMALLQARSLWDRPHLQGFPLALIGSLVLARMATRGLGALQPGPNRSVVGALGFCWLLLAVAGLTAWPWLGGAAVMATAVAVALGLGGWPLLRAVLPAWSFAALAVLPPRGTDLSLITRLQSWVTACVSPVLDAAGVLHLTEGNVIRIAGHRLMVEQACSGVHSLFVVLGGTIFFVLLKRRGALRGALLIVAAAGWVFLGNVARVMTVVFSQARWGVDLSVGWPHEVLGFLVLAASFSLTISTDQLIRYLSALTTIRPFPPMVDLSEKTVTAPRIAEPARPTILPALGRTWLGSRPILIAFGVLGLVEAAWLWPLLAEAVSANPVVRRLQSVNEGDMPEQLGSYRRQSFKTEDRGGESAFGEFSRSWTYQAGEKILTVQVDYPFRGWHELTRCYQRIGWTIREQCTRTGVAGVYVDATFDNPQGLHAMLTYGLDDMEGHGLPAMPSRSWLEYLGNRLDILRSWGRRGVRATSRYVSMPACYQVQLLTQADSPLSAAERDEARAYFEQVRLDLRRRVVRSTSPATKEGTR